MACASPCRCRIRQGFTLIELLVVIAIIAILAGLIAVVAYKARITAMNSRMKRKVMALDQAVNAFRSEVWLYPTERHHRYGLHSLWPSRVPRWDAS